jgi:trimeric autotransporter adhesin
MASGSYEVIKGPAEQGNEEAVAGVESAASVAEARKQAGIAADAASTASTAASTAAGAALQAQQIVASVGDAGAAAQQAITAAAQAVDSAAAAATSASGATIDADAADAARIGAEAAQASATSTLGTIGHYVTDAPEVETEPGKLSFATFPARMQAMLDAAPILSGKYLTGGSAGTDTVDLTTAHLFHTFENDKASGHHTKLKCHPGLYAGPPPAGQDRSYAWVHLLNSGAGNLVVEGPQDPGGSTTTTVYPPVKVVDHQSYASDADQTAANVARTVNVALPDVPAGSGRRFVAFLATTYHADTTPGHSATIAVSGVTGLTKLQEGGHGTTSNANPILLSVWHGTFSDGAAVTGLTAVLGISAMMARYVLRVFVFQDTSGQEGSVVTPRAGSTTTVTQARTPTQAKSVVLAFAGFRNVSSSPVNLTPVDAGEDVAANGVAGFGGAGNAKDISFATLVDNNAAASARTYTGTAAAGNPAIISAIVLPPRTVTTTTGDDGLITALAKPATLAPGQQGFLLVDSSGTRWYLDV